MAISIQKIGLVIALLAHLSSCEEKIYTIEKVADFETHGFTCQDNCYFKSVANVSDLPGYFPDTFRKLTMSDVMYIEGNSSNSDHVVTIPLKGAKVLYFEVLYYAECKDCIGYKHEDTDNFVSFPSTQNGRWLTGKSSFEFVLTNEGLNGFFFRNNRRNEFGIFKKLVMIVDVEPPYTIKAESLEDFAEDKYFCDGFGCELESVPKADDLPPYFSNDFAKLESTSPIMFVESNHTDWTVKNFLVVKPYQEFSDINFLKGFATFSAEYYMEKENCFGYGFGSVDTNWIQYPPVSGTKGVWSSGGPYPIELRPMISGNKLQQLGFFSFNNMDAEGCAVVFRKLEIRLYYDTADVKPTTTTTVPTTTTTATETATTSPTQETDSTFEPTTEIEITTSEIPTSTENRESNPTDENESTSFTGQTDRSTAPASSKPPVSSSESTESTTAGESGGPVIHPGFPWNLIFIFGVAVFRFNF